MSEFPKNQEELEKLQRMREMQESAEEVSDSLLRDAEALRKMHSQPKEHFGGYEIPKAPWPPEPGLEVKPLPPVVGVDGLNEAMSRGEEAMTRAEEVISGKKDGHPSEWTDMIEKIQSS